MNKHPSAVFVAALFAKLSLSLAHAGTITPDALQLIEAYKASMPLNFHNSSSKSFVDFNYHDNPPDFNPQNRIIRLYYDKDDTSKSFIVDVEVDGNGGSLALQRKIVKIDDFEFDSELFNELVSTGPKGPRYSLIHAKARAGNTYEIGELKRIAESFPKYDEYRTIALDKKPDPVRKVIFPKNSTDKEPGSFPNEIDFVWDGQSAFVLYRSGGNSFRRIDDKEINFLSSLFKKVVDVYQDAGPIFKWDKEQSDKRKAAQDKLFN